MNADWGMRRRHRSPTTCMTEKELAPSMGWMPWRKSRPLGKQPTIHALGKKKLKPFYIRMVRLRALILVDPELWIHGRVEICYHTAITTTLDIHLRFDRCESLQITILILSQRFTCVLMRLMLQQLPCTRVQYCCGRSPMSAMAIPISATDLTKCELRSAYAATMSFPFAIEPTKGSS